MSVEEPVETEKGNLAAAEPLKEITLAAELMKAFMEEAMAAPWMPTVSAMPLDVPNLIVHGAVPLDVPDGFMLDPEIATLIEASRTLVVGTLRDHESMREELLLLPDCPGRSAGLLRLSRADAGAREKHASIMLKCCGSR